MSGGDVAAILLLAAASGLTTLVGVVLAVRTRGRDAHVAFGVAFSAMIMLLLATLELAPEAVAVGGAPSAAAGGAVGIVVLLGLRAVLGRLPRMQHLGGGARTAILVAVGLIVHDVPEGFAMASAYLSTPQAGVVMAVAIASHNIPEEYAMAAPAARSVRPAVLYTAAAASALAEPFGALLGVVGIAVLPGLHGAFLGVAAGVMLLVALVELVPLAHRLGRPAEALAGVAASAGLYVVLAVLG